MTSDYGDSGTAAPPTAAGPLSVPTRPSSWPTVIGILGILYASWFLLGGFCGLIGSSSTMLAIPQEAADQDETDPEFTAIIERMSSWGRISSGIGMVVGIILLVASIMLLTRRRKATSLIKIWAIANVLVTILNLAVGLPIQMAFMEAFQNSVGGPSQGMPAGIQSTVVVIGVVLGLAIGLAPSVFILIWFSRTRIKDEVAEWQ